MSNIEPLKPADLYEKCDLSELSFETTTDLESLTDIIGQARAIEALHFGVNIKRDGFNLYVQGPPGIGKYEAVTQYLAQEAEKGDIPSDVCYVNNFENAQKPKVLILPPGRGPECPGPG